MKYCEYCRLSVNGKASRCPLCSARLKTLNNSADEVFPPYISIFKKRSLLFKWLMFISVVIAVISVGLNVIFFNNYSWSAFVIEGLTSMWIGLWIVNEKKDNIHKTLLWLVIAVCSLSVAWDYITGWRGWSVNYVLPSTFTAAICVMSVMAYAFKSERGDYIIYILLDCALSLMLAVFMAVNIITVNPPSIVCLCVSAISLAFIFIFKGGDLAEELKRRLHI